jgi:hypothetical protein
MLRTTFGLAAITLSACAGAGAIDDELAGETAADDNLTDGKADSAAGGAYTYFAITADLRKCASPMCGGFFMARLNRTTTICHDGTAQTSCYTPVLDWSEAALGADLQAQLVDGANASATIGDTRAIVRGRFAPTNGTPVPSLGRFIVTEAWLGQADQPASGVFVKVVDNGTRCITEPCPWLTERGLNTSRSAAIDEIDWSYAEFTVDQVADFNTALTEPSGLVMAGDRYIYTENGQAAKGRTCTQGYHRLVEAAAAH